MRADKGLSIIEILAGLVLALAVASIAIPLYCSSRHTDAARECLANLSAIAIAEQSYAEKTGHYTADMKGLVGIAGGLPYPLACPAGGKLPYSLTISGGAAATIVIRCPNDTEHARFLGRSDDYFTRLTMPGARTYSR